MEISPYLERIRRYNCKQARNNEWIGYLFYRQIGTLEDIPNIHFIGHSIATMEEGNGTETQTTNDNKFIDWIQHHNLVPELAKDLMMGLAHSHNNMECNPSGTDTNMMVRSSGQHKSYLSVICNNYGDWTARFCYREILITDPPKIQKYPKAFKGVMKPKEEEVVIMYDVDVIGQEPFSQIVIDQFNYARSVKLEKAKSKKINQPIVDYNPYHKVFKANKVNKKPEGYIAPPVVDHVVENEDVKICEYWLLQTLTGNYDKVEFIMDDFFHDSPIDEFKVTKQTKLFVKALKHVAKVDGDDDDVSTYAIELLDQLKEPEEEYDWLDVMREFLNSLLGDEWLNWDNKDNKLSYDQLNKTK